MRKKIFLTLFFIVQVSCTKNNDALVGIVNHIKNMRQVDLFKLYQNNFHGEQIKEISPQSGGFANLIFTLRSDRQDYILRLLKDHRAGPIFKDIYLSQLMHEKELSPKTYYVNYSAGMVIMEKIAHLQFYSSIKEFNEIPKLLAETLKRLHDVKPVGEYEPKNVLKAIESQLYGIKANGALEHIVSQIKNILPKVAHEQTLTTNSQQSFIHADLSPFNILFDGKKIWLIDWETAGYGNALYDVATVLSILLIEPDQSTRFLHSYFDRELSAIEQRALDIQKIICLINYGSFCLSLAREQVREKNFRPSLNVEYNYAQLKNAIAHIHEPNMQVHLAIMFFNEALRLFQHRFARLSEMARKISPKVLYFPGPAYAKLPEHS